MKRFSHPNTLKTLKKSGSLIFCSNCEKIIGSINKDGYNYINLNIACSCGFCGSVELSKNTASLLPLKRAYKMPDDKNGVLVCKKCGKQMFGVISDRVTAYSFFLECTCGEKYDTKPTHSKRLGETLNMLKKMEG